MPWSWIRVSRKTSVKLRDCIAGDTSASAFEACVRKIAEGDGATSVDVKFEASGLFARVSFYWNDPHVKYAVVYDLEGEQVTDLLGTEDIDRLSARSSEAT